MTDYMVIVNESNHMPPDFISTVELIDVVNDRGEAFRLERKIGRAHV